MSDDGKADITQPHDKFVRNIFADTELAADFFRNYLPEKWGSTLEWGNLKRESGDTVASDLSRLMSDLQYSARIKGSGKEVEVILLLEHQSSADNTISLRVLEYLCAAYKQRASSLKKGGKLPYPLAVVLYHGKKPWNEIPPMRDLIEIPQGEDADILKFPLYLIDLAAMSAEQLRGHPMVRTLLDSLQSASTGVLSKRLREIVSRLLNNLDEKRRVKPWLMALFNYYAAVRGEADDIYEEFKQALTGALGEKEAGKMATTMLDQIQREGIAKGKEEGEAEGMVKGQIKTLITVLDARFGEIPAALHKKLMTVHDDARIEKISKLAVTCQSLKEFTKAL